MQKTKLPSLVSILILTVLTVVMWISLNIYRALTTSPAPVVTPVVSEPINPTLDIATIAKIQSSLLLDRSQIPQTILTTAPVTTTIPTAIPTIEPETTPEASASAEPSPTPTTEI